MPHPVQPDTVGTILLIGASRGLGLALAEEFAKRRWQVVAIVRGSVTTKLHDVVAEYGRRIEIETIDITRPDQIMALDDRLAGRMFDMLFVNAGTANMKDETVAHIPEEFARVLVTNALARCGRSKRCITWSGKMA